MSDREHNLAINGAFLMEGFLSAGFSIPELAESAEDGWSRLVADLTECASYIEDKYLGISGPDNPDGLPGVFDYEVTSEVGSWLAKCLKGDAEHLGIPPLAQIKVEIDRRVAEFMAQ